MFAPHFPRIHHQRIYSFADPAHFKELLIKPSDQIQSELIRKEWDNVQRVIASLLDGKTQQYTLIKKFSAENYYHPTKAALWEFDHILRSLHVLRSIDDPELCQAIREALNRDEAYHQLCRTIAYIGGGRFRGMSEAEIDIWNDCARLIAIVIMYYNSRILSAVFETTKNEADKEIIARISPIAWSHLNLIGHYEFSKSQRIDAKSLKIKRA